MGILLGALILMMAVLSGGAQIDVMPVSFQEAVTQAVHVSCIPDGTSARAKEILVIAISKDSAKAIVNIRPPSQIGLGKDVTSRFKAEGVIDNSNSASSYLNLTIGYPQIEDAGDYTCAFSYIDETGLLQQDKAHGQVVATKSNASSVADDIKILEAKVSNLLERVTTVEKENFHLQTQLRNHSQQINNIVDKEHYTVAFSAAVENQVTITSGQTIIFSDIIINEGQGYNETIGEFTAPRAGLYVFHVVLEIGPAGSVGEVHVNAAGQNVAKLYTQDTDYGDQSSVSTVSHLQAGAVVKIVVQSAAGSSNSSPQVFGGRLCVFSGYLISVS